MAGDGGVASYGVEGTSLCKTLGDDMSSDWDMRVERRGEGR